MKLSRIACAVSLLLAVSACDDSSSSSESAPAVDLQGTWLHQEGSELRDRLRFQGDRVFHESFRMRCQLSQTEGTWTLQGNILRVTSDTSWSRNYDPDAKDSASFCAWEPSGVLQETGSRWVELANITASSFDMKTREITFKDGASTVVLVIEHYVRQ